MAATLDLKKDKQTAVPVWIRLKNLPLDLWSALAIGDIASAVGKPLYVDQRTEEMKMLSFARVCVEIYANQPRCSTVDVVLNGVSRSIAIEFEWKPLECLSCGTFGHRCEDNGAVHSMNKGKLPVLPASDHTPSGHPGLEPPAPIQAPEPAPVLEENPEVSQYGWTRVKGKKKEGLALEGWFPSPDALIQRSGKLVEVQGLH
ncbi:hypothetical protein ACJRO7_001407 [Eucalyptus globulus]|uniref:DUF4283 domain-containing protein n=1 Tax=Eucalyptus globulus TaxID=34317 RepID=A0ABD3LQT1_EUCGL